MQTELREAARRICKPEEIHRVIEPVFHLGKACFVQGLNNERIQTIVRSTGESILLLQAIEIALGGAILSTREKFGAGGKTVRCKNCNRFCHIASKCVPKYELPPANARAVMSLMSCYKCGREGHLARLSTEFEQGIIRTKGSRGMSSGKDVRYPEQGSSTVAACGVQKRNWARSGNECQRPMHSQSCPKTRRQ
jgi:hypothetical protein